MYQLNPQSNEYGKAILTPTKAEVCTEEGLRALMIDIANYKGYDKLIWEERVTLFAQGGNDWKKPILGRKAIRAYNKAIKDEPVAHFIELDGVASGIQMMACLSGCVESAKLCGLVDVGYRSNPYQHINDKMSKYCDMTDIECKYPLMTHMYGSKKVPRETFNEEQLEVFYKVLDKMIPGCVAVMDIIGSCWNPHTLEHSWIMPDKHVVKVKVIETVDTEIEVDELNGRRVKFRYEKNMPSTNGVSILGNVIHSVDSWVCREMVRRCNFEMSTIHDAYQCHPNNAEVLKQTYREILSDMTKTNLLDNICSQLLGRPANITIDDEGLGDLILDSSYALS